MTVFAVFGIYCVVCWFVIQFQSTPLQPDQLTDELADVDMTDVHRRREVQESNWRERPVVNIRLSRRG